MPCFLWAGNSILLASRSYVTYQVTYIMCVMYCFLWTAINCSNLLDPVNGQVSHTAGTTVGQTANYTCDPGYNLVGGGTRTCQATGVWSGSAPTCQGILSSSCICNVTKIALHPYR